MADSLHDSLTDTHQPRQSPALYQVLPDTLEGGLASKQGGGVSLQGGNWPGDAQPVHETRNTDNSNLPQSANGMDIDEGPKQSRRPLGASSVPYNIPATYLGQDHRRRGDETRKGLDERPNTSNRAGLPQDDRATGQDSTMGDGQSLASTDDQSLSGAAMPHEGGPSITHSEAVDALAQAEQGLEVGGGYSDDGYQTDSSATSQSLATSAREFIFEHGRRYHSYKADVNPYLFPNDDREQDREDLKHAMFLKLFNKTLHFAPVPAMGANVIDLGTGTGIWCVDCAYQQSLGGEHRADRRP
jgi:hypothetical protein